MAEKQYADAAIYEKKLRNVMARFSIPENQYSWDYSRKSAWVEFYYKGQLYRFEHSVENAKAHGQDISYGSDIFAQIVLALEDLARISGRGIYDLQTWVVGLKAIAPRSSVPSFFAVLGLDHVPATEDEIDQAYRMMAKLYHPDAGGSNDAFVRLQNARDEAKQYLLTQSH